MLNWIVFKIRVWDYMYILYIYICMVTAEWRWTAEAMVKRCATSAHDAEFQQQFIWLRPRTLFELPLVWQPLGLVNVDRTVRLRRCGCSDDASVSWHTDAIKSWSTISSVHIRSHVGACVRVCACACVCVCVCVCVCRGRRCHEGPGATQTNEPHI